MIKLYGFAASNYFNIVKHTLIAKGTDYEEVTCYPGQDPDYESKSPMGKVPCIETEEGFLSETSAILDYLEERYPQTPLQPQSAFLRARARQIIKFAELYLELPARRHLPEFLAGAPRSDEAFQQAKPLMQKGVRALTGLCDCTPYLIGDKLTSADIFVRYVVIVAKIVGKQIYDWNPMADSEKLDSWYKMISADPISQRIDSDSKAAMGEFLAYMRAR